MKMNLTNQKFGRLTANEIVRTVPGKGNIWRCECECGGEKEVPAAYLRNGHTRSCGCLNKEREERLDITGQRWGRLTAVRLVRYEDIEGTGKRRAIWLFRCDSIGSQSEESCRGASSRSGYHRTYRNTYRRTKKRVRHVPA